MVFELNTLLCFDWIYSISLYNKSMTSCSRLVWAPTNNQRGERYKRKERNSVYVTDLYIRNNSKMGHETGC